MTGLEIAVILGASLLGAFVKAVTGMGFPLIAIPLITLVVGIEDAAVIVAAPNVTANAVLCWRARAGRAESRDLRVLVGAGMLGAVAGTFLLVSIDEDLLLGALVATIVAFVVQALRVPDLRTSRATAKRFSPPVGLAAGVMQGAVGVSGPVVAAWLHGYRLSKDAYVYSVTSIFGLSGAVQLMLLAASGVFDAERAAVSAVVFIPALAVIPLGARLRAGLGSRGFDRAVLGILVLSSAALVVRIVT